MKWLWVAFRKNKGKNFFSVFRIITIHNDPKLLFRNNWNKYLFSSTRNEQNRTIWIAWWFCVNSRFNLFWNSSQLNANQWVQHKLRHLKTIYNWNALATFFHVLYYATLLSRLIDRMISTTTFVEEVYSTLSQ